MKQGNEFLLSTQERAVIEAMRGGANISVNFLDLDSPAKCEAELDPFSHIGMELSPFVNEDKQQWLMGFERILDVSASGEYVEKLGFLSVYASTKKPAAEAPATDDVNSSTKHLQEEL